LAEHRRLQPAASAPPQTGAASAIEQRYGGTPAKAPRLPGLALRTQVCLHAWLSDMSTTVQLRPAVGLSLSLPIPIPARSSLATALSRPDCRVMVAPHRMKRPWNGAQEPPFDFASIPQNDPTNPLSPGVGHQCAHSTPQPDPRVSTHPPCCARRLAG